MAFTNQPLPRCPGCGDRALSIIECRRTKISTRRRRECSSCGLRLTTHEVSQEWFQAAEENARALAVVRSALAMPSPAVACLCEDCALNTGTRCSLNLPEYGCSEANGCPAYKAVDQLIS